MLIKRMADSLKPYLPGESPTHRLVQLSLCIWFLLSTLMLLPGGVALAYGTSGSNSGFKAVSASYSHTAAVKSDGTVWTWGANDHGQLGYETSGLDQKTPRQVEGLPSNIASIAAGGNPDTGTAFTVAIDSEGNVYATGSNNLGQLGDGATGSRASFNPVKTDIASPLIVPNGKLSAGFDFAGVLNPASGEIRIWGENQYGQLGNQNTAGAQHYAVPVQINSETNLSGVTELSFGGQHGLALKEGVVYSWGRNNRGQLGTNVSLDINSIYAAAIRGTFESRIVDKIAAGSYHNIAYSATGGFTKIWSWGENGQYELGIGYDRLAEGIPLFTENHSPFPRPVDHYYGLGYAFFNAPSAIAAGGKQMIILDTLDDDPELEYFEGDGGVPSERTNLPLAMGEVIAIAAGHQQTLALTAEGKLWGKGDNTHGQLGLGAAGKSYYYDFTQPLFPLPSELKSLTITEGTLEPAFNHYVRDYTLNVGSNTTEVNLSALTYFSNAKGIVIGGTSGTTDQLTATVPINYGSNLISVGVTGSDDSTTSYTVQINRASPDSNQLEQAITEASDYYHNSTEGIEQGQYFPGALTALNVALQSAMAVKNNGNSLQSELDTAAAALNMAIADFLTKKVADRVTINALLISVQQLYDTTTEGTSTGQYRTGARSALLTAIQAARSIRDNPLSSQSDINNAHDALLLANIDFMSKLTPNRGPILALLGTAEELRNTSVEGAAQGQYEPGSIAVLQSAILTAITARDNAALSKEELDSSAAALQAAISIFAAKEVPPFPVALLDFEANNGGFTSNGLWEHTPLTFGDLHAHSGSKVWALNLAGSISGYHTDTLMSSSIDLTSSNAQSFRISWWQFNSPELEYTNSIYVSKDGGQVWDLIPIAFVQGGAWTQRSIKLDASYAVKNFKIKIQTTTANLVPAAMMIDDAKIERFSTSFNQSISDAQALHQSSVEGTESGLYANGSKAQLQQAISIAIAIRDSNPGMEAVDAAVAALKQAVHDFHTYKYLPALLYNNSFESTPCDFNRSQASVSWECGTPTIGPNSAHSGNKVWGTSLSHPYTDNQDSDLISPVINLSSAGNTVPLSLSWWQWIQTEKGYDGLKVFVSKNSDPDPVWSEVFNESGGDARWVQKKIILDSSYAVSNFKVLFKFYSDSSVTETGVFLDDILISSLDMSSLTNEVWQAQHLLANSQEGNSVGYYEAGAKTALNTALISAETEAAKSLQYQKQVDDATAAIQQAIAQFKAKLKQPYLIFNNDFEMNDGGFTTGTLEMDNEGSEGSEGSSSSSWAHGIPSSGPNQAASGNKLWATNLAGNFNLREHSYLVSPAITATGTDAWKLSVNWMQWVGIQSCCGSIMVEASKDGGEQWQTIFLHTRNEINDPASVPILDSVWQPMQVDLDSSYLVSNLKIRFLFDWYSSHTSPGWYIDDVQVAAYPKDLGYTISQAEDLLAHTVEGTGSGNYPAGSKAALQLHTDSAKAMLLNPSATPAQMLAAQSGLNEAIAQYRSQYISGFLNQINKGSYVELGGKKWLLWEPSSNGLLLGMNDVYNIHNKPWSIESEGPDTIKYIPSKAGSLANYLNVDFYNSLSSQKDWINTHTWVVQDNASDTVEAKVGLLNSQQYKALSDYPEYGGDSTLHHQEWQNPPSEWWLLTPKASEQKILIAGYEGSIVDDDPQSYYAVRPVIHLNPSIGVISGTGSLNDPYQLAMLSNVKELTNVTSSHGVITSVAGDYQVEVPYSASSIKLTWAISPLAHIGNVTGAVYDTDGWVVSLPNPGSYEVQVPVYAQDKTLSEHKITIIRGLGSSDTSLLIVPSTGVVEYTGPSSIQIKVAHEVAAFSLTPTVHAGSTISIIGGSVTGAVYNSGIISVPDLLAGINTLQIKITAEDGTDTDYSISIIRLSSNANLSSLTLGGASQTLVANKALQTFMVNVPYSTNSLDIVASLADSKSTLRVDGEITFSGKLVPKALIVGVNTFEITVTAEDGTTVFTYHIDVNRADLSNAVELILSVDEPYTISPTNTDEFTINLPHSVDTLRLYAAVSSDASIGTVTGAVYSNGIIEITSLIDGLNTVTVPVKAPDLTTRTYTIKINRATDTSNDATVSSVTYGSTPASRSGNTFSFTMSSVTQSVYFYIQPNVSSAQLEYVSGNVTGVTYGRKGAGYELYVPMLRNDTTELKFKVRSANGSNEEFYLIKAISVTPLGQPKPVNSGSPTVTFSNGVTVDLSNATLGPDAKLTVTLSDQLYDREILTPAGDILDFTLTGVIIDPNNPVRLEFPIKAGSDKNRSGVFYFNKSTNKWEYQPTVITPDGKAVAFVTHFSVYGVFEANRVATVQPTETRLPNGEAEITLTTATAGSDVIIYYTLNNTPPTSGSLIYDPANKPKLAANQKLQAFAAKPGMLDSVITIVTAHEYAVIDISYVLQSILLKKDMDGKPGFTKDDVLQLLQLIQPRVVTPAIQGAH
ncbi:RCC1 domain-containing protein [Paenibacillus foliorum]|nr:cadherin-like beta sandwich domain-containing protein [Paenibacillus foliorum]